MGDSKKFDYLDLSKKDFGRNGVIQYSQKRYSGFDQRFVDFREKKIIKNVLKKYEPLTILEVPSGFGRFTAILKNYGKVVCADFSMDMLLFSKNKNKNCRFIRCDIRNLPFKDNSFDTTLCIRLLHHREYSAFLEQILGELGRVTSKTLIISVYEKSPIHIIWRKIFKRKGEILFLNPKNLLPITEKLGLKTILKIKVIPFIHGQKIIVFNSSEEGEVRTSIQT